MDDPDLESLEERGTRLPKGTQSASRFEQWLREKVDSFVRGDE